MKLKIILIISILALSQNAFAGFSDFSFMNWSFGPGHNKHHKDRITATLLAVFGTLTATHADTAGNIAWAVSVTLLPGTLTVYVSNVGGTLTGDSITASGGTLTPQASNIMAISGQSLTASVGTLTGSASVAGSQNLTGNYVIASGGILSGVAAGNPSPSVLMSGNSVQAATGLFLPTVTQIMAITGGSESVTSSGGTLLACSRDKIGIDGQLGYFLHWCVYSGCICEYSDQRPVRDISKWHSHWVRQQHGQCYSDRPKCDGELSVKLGVYNQRGIWA